MAFSMTAAVAQVRVLVDELTGMTRVYAASENDANAIPMALNEFPCAMVLPGQTLDYKLMKPHHRHSYEIKVQIFESGPDIGQRVNTVLPFVDLFIDKFRSNVALGMRVNSCLFDRQTGLIGLEYGGIEYSGYELVLRVSEEENTTAEIGA